jgi:hypothetical protein
MTRKLIAIVSLSAVLMLGITSAASGHPSENRALQGFGGDPNFPHCHMNLNSGNFAFPSHKAHEETGLVDGVFEAAPCPQGVFALAVNRSPLRSRRATFHGI